MEWGCGGPKCLCPRMTARTMLRGWKLLLDLVEMVVDLGEMDLEVRKQAARDVAAMPLSM